MNLPMEKGWDFFFLPETNAIEARYIGREEMDYTCCHSCNAFSYKWQQYCSRCREINKDFSPEAYMEHFPDREILPYYVPKDIPEVSLKEFAQEDAEYNHEGNALGGLMWVIMFYLALAGAVVAFWMALFS